MACMDVTDIIQALAGMTVEQIDAWLDTPNERLGGITPQSALAAGDFADVRFAASQAVISQSITGA